MFLYARSKDPRFSPAFNSVIKSNPITRLNRPLGFHEVEAPRLRQSAHEGGKVVSCMHQLPEPHRKYSWYLCLLEVESTPGPLCSQKDYVNEKCH
jgi:hypothetical protein